MGWFSSKPKSRAILKHDKYYRQRSFGNMRTIWYNPLTHDNYIGANDSIIDEDNANIIYGIKPDFSSNQQKSKIMRTDTK